MTQAFLNEPTIAAAHQKYLESWMLPSVQASWNGRRPSIKQFEKRYGEAHTARQHTLELQGREAQIATVLEGKRIEDIQELAEAVEQGVNEMLASLLPPRFAELLDGETPESQEPSAPEARTVKPGNENKLPTAKQLYFYLHRAIEAGHKFVTIPVTRGMAAEGRSMMAEGKSYRETLTTLSKKYQDKAAA